MRRYASSQVDSASIYSDRPDQHSTSAVIETSLSWPFYLSGNDAACSRDVDRRNGGAHPDAPNGEDSCGSHRSWSRSRSLVRSRSLRSAQEITGAGATFPYPIYSKWSDAYRNQTGVKLNYQSIGSGGGIAQIKAATVVFGASDAPLPPEQLHELGLAQFPMVIGGVVPVVNIEGIQAGQLRFTGPLLADIYLGKIKKWNDPALAAANPGVQLPDLAITVVHRSDGSGTTFNWVNYLSKISPEWKEKVGEGTSVSWPTGVGGKGNEGVAEYVNRIKGSIGYVEYAYVLQNKMTYGLVQNQAGNFIKPEHRELPGCCGQRGLAEDAGLLPDTDECARPAVLSDHRRNVHSDVQAAQGSGRQQGRSGLLQMGVGEWPAIGEVSRLCSVAACSRQPNRSLLASADS